MLIFLIVVLGRILSQPAVYDFAPKLPQIGVKTAHTQRFATDPKSALNRRNTPKVALIQPLSVEEKVNLLITCESGGNPAAVGDNGKARGILQFWRGTLEIYAKRYGLRNEITEKDLIDSSLQKEVAIKMLEESPKNLSHWFACSKKMNLIAQK